ncbi:MAG TPA: DUF4136 domain-containing protein [Lacunisphaera sp.]|nr:DUF4136 domain-containing protein [Lacunisphaera sp.]
MDAIAAPAQTGGAANSGKSYQIRDSGPQGEGSELRYKEVSDFVRTALSSKGLYEAPPGQKADVIIAIDYGVEAPRVKFDSVSTPVFVDTKDESYYIKETVFDSTGVIIGTRDVKVDRPGRHEYLGQETEVTPEIVYEKYLKVSARENTASADGRAPAEVWSVNVSAEDTSKELRKYIPILASATADYIGTNTKAAVPVKIGESDAGVKFIKQGL